MSLRREIRRTLSRTIFSPYIYFAHKTFLYSPIRRVVCNGQFIAYQKMSPSNGNDNPPTTPPRRGFPDSPLGRGQGWVHSCLLCRLSNPHPESTSRKHSTPCTPASGGQIPHAEKKRLSRHLWPEKAFYVLLKL